MQVKRAGRYEGEFIPPPQMDNLYQRLQRVCTMAPQRERRLEYEEMKYHLLAYLVASENKLKMWTVKYGRQEAVEELLEDYVVSGTGLFLLLVIYSFQNIPKLQINFKKLAGKYLKKIHLRQSKVH